MINFSENNQLFKLRPIKEKDMIRDVETLYVDGERTLGAYSTVRDQVIFTNKRVIAIDVEGVTGTRRDYSSLPYSKIQYFSAETPGLMEIVPDALLELDFNNGFVARFQFTGRCSILEIAQAISEYVL